MKSLYWKTINIRKEIISVYNLLFYNYIEDDGNNFRLNYSKDFLMWALTPPNYYKEWHLGLEVIINNNKQLIGFISGIPVTTSIEGKKEIICEINFLCVDKKFRNIGITKLLIEELTKRIKFKNIQQGIYTSGDLFLKPFSSSKSYQKLLNVKKLIEVKFCERHTDEDSLYNKVYLKGLRLMEDDDVLIVNKLLNKFLKKFKIHPEYNKREFLHWFLKKDIVKTYVVENNNKITDFCSFYILYYSIIDNNKYKNIKVAYLYYYFNFETPLKILIDNIVIIAKILKVDVFTFVDIMDNKKIITSLQFKPCDNFLHYYLYGNNNSIPSKDIGFTMI